MDDSSHLPAQGEDALAPYLNEIRAAVYQAASGADAGQVLDALISRLPAHLRALIIQRFRKEMEALNQEFADAKRREEAAKREQEQAQKQQRTRFSLSEAARLMTSGALDKIRALLSRRPDLARAIDQVGDALLKSGVAADAVRLQSVDDIGAPALTPVDKTREKPQQNR